MRSEKQQLWLILLIVFLGFIGTSLAYPLFPPLFLHPSLGSLVSADWSEDTRKLLLGLALAAYPLGQFVGSPVLGSCSDHYGRKRVLLLSLAGSGLGYLLSALSLQANWLWLLLASRFLTGLMEGNLAIARAMAVDLGSISKYKSLGRINSASALGYVIGPLFGGFLSDSRLSSWFSYSLPFYIALSFSLLCLLLAAFKLHDKTKTISRSELTLRQRFHLYARLKPLFKRNPTLRYLLIVSTLFTFAVDIFYEFGPVYLTGLWKLAPAGIAVYNANLSLTLALGASWLPYFLSHYFSVERVVLFAMLLTALVLGTLAFYPAPLLAFILFGVAGFAISTVNTNLVIQVSHSADPAIQGEAMGAQVSLRMLGDTVICLTGGFLILSSVVAPLVLSCLITLCATGIYLRRF